MGENAEDILASTNIPDDDRKQYASVVKQFDDFFKVRKNVIFERARFNRRCQAAGETAEQFITSLYTLAESCDYGDLKDQMIRDRIVVGICDQSQSERLQMDADLTLEKAKKLVRQREAVHEQQILLKTGQQEDKSVDFVQQNTVFGSKAPQRKRSQAPVRKPEQKASKCSRCGRGPHSRQQCPARDAECHNCGKKGHYSAQCFKKSVSDVTIPHEPEVSDYDMAYLNTVGSSNTTTWNCTVLLNDHEVPFKVDTGAEVTVISEDSWKSLGLSEMKPPTKKLHGPDRQPLKVRGEIHATLSYRGCQCIQPVFIVKHLQHNLLGLPAIQALQILTQVHAVSTPIPEQYPGLFKGLGTFKGSSYEIKLKPEAKPFALFTPRNVPLPLRKKVQEELVRMETMGVISRVEEPTPWCAGMVVVPKKSGSVRICVDFRPLNDNVLREVHPLPKVDMTLAQLAGATVFSKLDANCGFWQIPLDETSRHLTTFITPFGRYCFNKLPFGISSAPEHFQRRMSEILEGQEGVLCHMDDVLIFGRNQVEHDARLHSALQRVQEAGLTLNQDKCEFSKQRLIFLGHVIDEHGVSADPSKTTAVAEMETPRSVSELRRFMGMANQLGKFTPRITEISQPLRELLSSKRSWVWGPAQEEAFKEVKAELTRPTTLALYSPDLPTKICADASTYGLGAVLLQEHNEWKPVAFASRSMTDTEKRYSQIEKEALALVWACEKFSDYVIGKSIQLETDHKPLVPLLGYTNLDCLPPRVLRFRIRLMRFDYSISHVPGKLLYTADTLSRAPVNPPDVNHIHEDKQTELFVHALASNLPASADRLKAFRDAQQKDSTCSQLITFCKQGWPNKSQLTGDLSQYWRVRGELSLHDDLLLRGQRILVPRSLQQETLNKIHSGHQGIQRCRLRISTSVWWPGISRQMEQLVKNCPECAKASVPHRQPMIGSPLPSHPWEKVASDLFELNGKVYLLVVDYFSRYMEIQTLTTTTSLSIIRTLKAIFARHGIPSILVSDNGPQYSSTEMQEFAQRYNFLHITSSPHYPQSNGMAERAVKTAKSLLEKSADPHMALLSYRATPLPWCGLSPAELLMDRRLQTDIPQPKKVFIPDWPYLADFREQDEKQKRQQKAEYDRRHRARPLPPLPNDETVWVRTQDRQVPGRVIQPATTPRSYIMETPSGTVRRNQSHLSPRPGEGQSESVSTEPQQRTIATRSQTGTHIGPPSRLTYWKRGDVAYW